MRNDLRITERFRVMGTEVVLDLVVDRQHENRARIRIKRTRTLFEEMEHRFSRFDVSSELSFVNAHCGAYVQVSKDFLDVLEMALKYHHESRGLFDPRVHDALVRAGYDRDFHTHDLSKPDSSQGSLCDLHEIIRTPLRNCVMIDREHGMVKIDQKIDLTGIVKGWAVDRARMCLMEKNDHGAIIDAGGDMWVQGADEHGQNWYIGIEGVDDDEILMKVDGEGVATSGVTRRHWMHNGSKRHHLIDPRNVTAVSFDISTVTVIARTVMDADVWAKVLFLKGIMQGLAYANAHAIKAIFIDYNHKLYVSQYAQKNIV